MRRLLLVQPPKLAEARSGLYSLADVFDAGISEEYLETADINPHTFVKSLLAGKQIPECGFNYHVNSGKTGITWSLRKQDNNHSPYFVDTIADEKQ